MTMSFDVEAVRKDFPILAREVHGVPLVYLDSANTSQKPQVVIDAWPTSTRSTTPTSPAPCTPSAPRRRTRSRAPATRSRRSSTRRAATRSIFTKNISEALNLLAYSLSNATTFPGAERFRLGPGDEIVVTEMEHHSNIVPWQLLAQRTGATFRWIPIDDDGRLVESAIDEVITERTKVVVVRPPVQRARHDQPGAAGRRRGPARSARWRSSTRPSRRRTCRWTCRRLGADFVAFTGHKLYGPTGVGVLWGRYDLLAELPPFLGGGEMIETVDHERHDVRRAAAPLRGGHADDRRRRSALGAAVDYLTALGMDEHPRRTSTQLIGYALGGLADVDGLRIIGPATSVDRGATISFTLEGVHPHDVAQLLDEQGIAVRAGHHCARPVCVRYGIPATTRASFGVYTTIDEIDALVRGGRAGVSQEDLRER